MTLVVRGGWKRGEHVVDVLRLMNGRMEIIESGPYTESLLFSVKRNGVGTTWRRMGQDYEIS